MHHGDCLEVMAGMAAASVDLVVTDPPYFVPVVHYNTRTEFPRSLSDLSMLECFYREWFKECARVLKPTGAFYVFCDAHSYPVFYALGYRHAKKQRLLVWDKAVSFTGFTWRRQHELILFGEMGETPCHKTGDGDILRHRCVPVEQRLHPAEKPVGLLRQLIKKSLPAGGVVLDPFMGSGATGVAAREEGCPFIGIERDAEYYGMGKKRTEAWEPGELQLT